MPHGYSPRDHLLRIYRGWWLIVLLALIGALAGGLVYTTREPIYASSIEFAVTIDPAQTGVLEEREYDRLQHSFGRIFYAQDIINQTLRAAAEQGIEMDVETFRRITVQEWRGSVWEYTVYNPDPEIARTVAEIWGDTATAALQSARTHAQEAQVLQAYMDNLAACGDPELTPGSGACVTPPYEDIEQELATLIARWEEAVSKSRTLIPAVAFEQTRSAALPDKPVTSGRATLVFLSAVIGMLVGIWLVNLKRFGGNPPSS